MEQFRLRKATAEDVDIIFEWANDDDGRRNSFHPCKINYEDHLRWYENKLLSSDTIIYIYYSPKNLIGQIRIEIEEGTALISYFVEKKYRGQGHGKNMLRLIKQEVMQNHNEVKKLLALTKQDNYPSQKVFEAAGYNKKVINERGIVEYEYSLRE